MKKCILVSLFALFSLNGTQAFAGVCYLTVYHTKKPAAVYCTDGVGDRQCSALIEHKISELKNKDSRYYYGEHTWISNRNRIGPFEACEGF